MNRRAGVFGAGPDMIDAFKRQWPCHGLPDTLNCLVGYFAANGDLVDVEAFDADGKPLDTIKLRRRCSFEYVVEPSFATNFAFCPKGERQSLCAARYA